MKLEDQHEKVQIAILKEQLKAAEEAHQALKGKVSNTITVDATSADKAGLIVNFARVDVIVRRNQDLTILFRSGQTATLTGATDHAIEETLKEFSRWINEFPAN